jgi:energy-coupling factor transport system ATP-binding protein
LRTSIRLRSAPTAQVIKRIGVAIEKLVKLAAQFLLLRGMSWLIDHVAALDIAQRLVALDGSGRIIADGPATRVIAERRDALEANGVWLPDGGPPEPVRGRPGVRGDMVLRADALAFTYPGADAPALRPTDLGVRSGEALAVVGPNGSGKSTLALLAGGLLRPGAGDIRVSGALRPSGDEARPWRWPAPMLAGRIGSVFQNPEHQFLGGSLRDELRIGPRRLALPDAERRVGALMEELELGHLAEANPFTLSGGERRRLSVGTALATDPAMLVLDEPTFGQDGRTWRSLLALLARLRDDGRALVVMTHDEDFVAALADRVVTLPAPG